MKIANRRPEWETPALLFAVTLFFYWKVLFTDRVMFPWDAADFFYPYFAFVHDSLRHFRLPLWDPYVMSGFPIIGDPEAQIFYPINWLFVVLNPFSPLSYKMVECQLILHFFLAGLFMYYLARSFVPDTVPALLGAVLFMLSGAMVAHTQHLASINAMAWYPLVFLLARRGLLESNYFYTASAGMLFGIQVLAGHWQHSVYLGLFLFLFYFYEACFGPLRANLWPRWIYQLLAIGAIGAALALVQIIPTFELGRLSVRSYLTYWDVTQGNEPLYLWTLFLPNFFGGLNGFPLWYPYDFSFNYVFLTVPGCLLALLGLVQTVRQRNFFWLASTLLFIELSLGRNGHLAGVLYHIPLLNLFRNTATFFDLANFVLCLMAGLGAHWLFSAPHSQRLRKLLPISLTILLLLSTALGLLLRLGERIHGWYHMLAVLAVVSLVLTAMLKDKLSRSTTQWALLGLMVFQLCHYSMNQKFNWSIENPRRYLSWEYAANRKETLHFLRSDPSNDFRVAAIAEYPWSGNGWNVWRIPGIFGWNPLTLERYDRYIRTFTHTSEFTLPYGGADHNLDSPLLDLLGTKYLVMGDPDLEKKLRLPQSGKFRHVFQNATSWSTYRSDQYLSRGWFYPRAYVVPNEEIALAVMNSHWFEARRTLVIEKGDLSGEGSKLAEDLSAIAIRPDGVAAASNGIALADPYCADHRRMFGDWVHKGNWFRYDVTGPERPGRYLLLMQYTAAESPAPLLRTNVQNQGEAQSHGPVRLPMTYEWGCYKSRTAELGEFEIRPGQNQITLHFEADSGIHIYSLWLVRLPASPPSKPETFSFDDFSASANQISFNVQVDRDGFLLLNEIYYPGWEAKMDGKPVEILRADSIFRALYVPAGTHHIEMLFRPRYFAWGAAISLLTLLAFGAYSAARWSQRARPS